MGSIRLSAARVKTRSMTAILCASSRSGRPISRLILATSAARFCRSAIRSMIFSSISRISFLTASRDIQQ